MVLWNLWCRLKDLVLCVEFLIFYLFFFLMFLQCHPGFLNTDWNRSPLTQRSLSFPPPRLSSSLVSPLLLLTFPPQLLLLPLSSSSLFSLLLLLNPIPTLLLNSSCLLSRAYNWHWSPNFDSIIQKFSRINLF